MASAACIQQCSQICVSATAVQASVLRQSASDRTCSSAHLSGRFLKKEGLALPLPGRLTTAAPKVASPKSSRLVARAVGRAPPGVEPPREEPKLPGNYVGFTENAEVWNSRAGMIGIFGIILVELFANRGILEMIGISVGKGLDLPL